MAHISPSRARRSEQPQMGQVRRFHGERGKASTKPAATRRQCNRNVRYPAHHASKRVLSRFESTGLSSRQPSKTSAAWHDRGIAMRTCARTRESSLAMSMASIDMREPVTHGPRMRSPPDTSSWRSDPRKESEAPARGLIRHGPGAQCPRLKRRSSTSELVLAPSPAAAHHRRDSAPSRHAHARWRADVSAARGFQALSALGSRANVREENRPFLPHPPATTRRPSLQVATVPMRGTGRQGRLTQPRAPSSMTASSSAPPDAAVAEPPRQAVSPLSWLHARAHPLRSLGRSGRAAQLRTPAAPPGPLGDPHRETTPA